MNSDIRPLGIMSVTLLPYLRGDPVLDNNIENATGVPTHILSGQLDKNTTALMNVTKSLRN